MAYLKELLLLLCALLCVQQVSGGLFSDVLDSITGLGRDSETPEDGNETIFYQEDVLATATMMVDFVTTPLYFVALFKYREEAIYEDGRPTNLTGFDADRIYTKVVLSEILPEVGGELVFIAPVENTTINSDEPQGYWDAMAVLYFPNSFAFGRMAGHSKFRELTPHKKAGLEDTLVFACESLPGTSMDAFNSTDTVAVARDGDGDPGPVATIDFIGYQRNAQYQEGDADAARSGREAVQKYYDEADPVAMSHGMRIAMEFSIQQALIQGAPDYSHLRISTYPSHAALEAFRQDMNTTLSGMQHHFVAGVSDTASLQASPMFVNSLGGNAQIGYYEACSSAPPTTLEQTSGVDFDASFYCP